MVSKTLASLDAWLALAEEVWLSRTRSGRWSVSRENRTVSTSSRSSPTLA